MARKTSTRKAAPRRRAPTKGKAKAKTSFAAFGWLAAVGLGLGWAASDGRPLAFVSALKAPDAPSSRIAQQPARKPSAPPQETRRESAAFVRPAERRDDIPPLRTAALPTATPRPAPRLGPMKMPHDPVPRPSRAEMPTAPVALAAATVPGPMRATATQGMAPAGSEHHATRRLDMRAAPDGASRLIASIESGTEVRVLRAEGPWRLVASAAGRSEGWVDGTYLAGEASAFPASPQGFRPQGAAVVEASILTPFSPTRDRQAAAAGLSAPRTRLPPAAISRQ